jgi:signal transduction histidine kinase/CheY-like chemotaxis protein/putative methionine-R-sulfoxide reductase with GAF domain
MSDMIAAIMPDYTALQAVIQHIQQAITPTEAAQRLLRWLCEQHGPAAVSLKAPDRDTAELLACPRVNAGIRDWLRLQSGWQHDTTPHWLPETETGGPALVVSLRCQESHYGLLWLHSPTPPGEHIPLLAQLLAAHLHQLHQQSTVQTLLNRSPVNPDEDTLQRMGQVMRLASNLLCRYFHYDSAQFFLYEKDKQLLRRTAAFQPRPLTLAPAPSLTVPLTELRFPWPEDHQAAPIVRGNRIGADPLGLPLLLPDAAGDMIVFLQFEAQTLGLLYLESRRPNVFRTLAVQVIQEIADHLAIVIQHVRMTQDTRILAAQLATLNQVAVLVNTTPRLDELGARVYESVSQLQASRVFQFAIFDRARQVLQVDQFGPAEPVHLTLPYAPERELISQIIARATPILWRTAAEQAALSRYLNLGADAPASFLGVPMIAQNTVLGAICLQSDTPEAFNETSLRLMTNFATSVAVALQNAEIFGQNARRLRELEAMNDVSRILATQLELQGIWEPLRQQIEQLFAGSVFFVGLLETETNQLRLPLGSEDSALQNVLSMAVIRHGIALYFRSLSAETDRLRSLGITLPSAARAVESWLGIPMRNRSGALIGVIGLQNLTPDSYSDTDVSLLTAVAAQLSLALENAQLLQAEQERRQLANTLIEVGRIVGSTLQLDEVLDRTLDQMQRVVAYHTASIMLLAEQTEKDSMLVIAATHGFEPHTRGFELRVSADHPVGLVLTSRQPLVLENAQSNPLWQRLDEFGGAPLVCSWIGVPLLVEDKPIGLITLDHNEPGRFTQRDANNAFAVARQVAVVVQNARMHAQSRLALTALQQSNQRLAAIQHISSVISSTLDRDEILRTAARQLTEIFSVDHCAIVLIEPHRADVQLVADYPALGGQGLRLMMRQRHLQERLAEGTIIVIDDIETSDLPGTVRAAWHHAGVVSILLVPLIARTRLIGGVSLHGLTQARRFTAWEQETLLMIARQLALAIANADLYEEAISANRLKSEFLAKITHELRTPLNAVIGYSDMLKSGIYGPLNEAQLDRMSRVHTAGTQLLELIDDVLDLSRIEAGQAQLHLESADLFGLIEQALAPVTFLAEKKGLALRQELDPDLPEIRVDPQRIRQVLTNLLDNAVKFTPSGSVTLEAYPVTVRRNSLSGTEWRPPPHVGVPDGKWVALRVIDTGVGIAADDQQFIFDAFRQVHHGDVPRQAGTGLGLAISYRFVLLHEGYMWVESTPGKGSIFTVLLPYDPLNPISETAELEAVDPDKQIILVLDDNPEDIQLARDYLNTDQLHVVGMTNPERVVELSSQILPAVVIVDVLMPQRSGWEVLRDLKTDAQTAHIPVLIWSVVDAREQAAEQGADAFLLKPVKRDALLAIVTRLASN